MKKLLFILFLFFSLRGLAQFPINATTGTATSTVLTRGISASDSAFQWRTNYPDTTTANLGLIKQMPGAVIRVNSTNFFVRNQTVNAWVALGGGASSDLANQGLIKSGSNVQFGQLVGAVGNPAAISVAREIPLDTASVYFFNQNNPFAPGQRIQINGGDGVTRGAGIDFLNGGSLTFRGIQNAGSAISWYHNAFLQTAMGVHLTGTTVDHFYLADMRNALPYVSVEIVGASTMNWLFDGATQIGLRGPVSFGPVALTAAQINAFAYAYAERSLYVGDSLRINNVLTGGSSDSVLVMNTATKLVKKVAQASISGANIYNSDGSLTGTRTLTLDGHPLLMSSGAAFTTTSLYLDPTANAEQVQLLAYNTTGGDNTAYVYNNTSATAAQSVLTATFNASAKSALIQLDASAGAGTINATANDGIAIIGGTMDIRSTASTLTLRTSVRAVDITDSIYAYPLPRTNDTTTYKIVGRSNHGGLVDMNWSNSSAAVTWNAITNPTGTQTLSWDDAELNAWTNGSNTETFLTVNNNSLTTGIGELWQSSSLTTGTLSSLISTSTALAAGNELLNLSVSGANGTNAITATGARISVTNTNATSGTNVGLDITASGATTDNIGVQSLANKNIFTPSTDNSNTLQIKDAGGTVRWQAGTFFGATTYGALYPSGTPSGVNYVLGFNNSQTLLNAPVDLYLRVNNVTLINIFSTGVAVGNGTTQATARLHIGAGTTAASTAPLKLITGPVNTTAEAGAMEYTTPQLFFTNGGAQRQEIQLVQQSRVSTQFDKTDQTLANITGLTATLVASGTYRFTAELFTTSDVTGGIKVAIGGTATATTIVYDGFIIDAGLTTQARSTTVGGSGGAVTAVTAAHVTITGLITVANAGTLTVQSARNAAAGTTSVLVGSFFEVNQIL